MKDWKHQLLVPLVAILCNALVTYGVVSTQLQWIRSDLDRQQRQIERIENKLLGTAKAGVATVLCAGI